MTGRAFNIESLFYYYQYNHSLVSVIYGRDFLAPGKRLLIVAICCSMILMMPSNIYAKSWVRCCGVVLVSCMIFRVYEKEHTNFIMKYLNVFVLVVGDAFWGSKSWSLADPLWKSKSAHNAWRHVVIRVVRGFSPLNTRWLYGSFPAIVPMVIVSVELEFRAVLRREHKIERTSRRGSFWTICKPNSDGFVNKEEAGI